MYDNFLDNLYGKLEPKKENNFCYLVRASQGYYEDLHTWTMKIFKNPIDAENFKREVEKQIEIELNLTAPFKEDDLETLSEKEIELYYEWEDRVRDAKDFRQIEVIEFELL